MNDFSFYFSIGWQHIVNIEALDHILFIAALAAIYVLKDWRQVLILVTAFTAGHTVTLILSTKQIVEVNGNLVEFLIPCTIVVTALSNLLQKNFTPRSVRINYFLALFFGLIHGLAFANTLRMILASDQSFALSMFSFSVGLEAGQVLIVFCLLLLSQLFISGLKIERKHWVIFLSAAVFGLALEMAVQRWPRPHPKPLSIWRGAGLRQRTLTPDFAAAQTLIYHRGHKKGLSRRKARAVRWWPSPFGEGRDEVLAD